MKLISSKSLVVLAAAYGGSLTGVDATDIGTAVPLPDDAEVKPAFSCSNRGDTIFELGGFNIPADEYETGLDMLNDRWRKVIVGTSTTDIQPAKLFNFSVPFVGDDDDFKFRRTKSAPKHFRGIGVDGIGKNDPEVSNDEALWVHFGGVKVHEVSFGTRAFFGEDVGSTDEHFEEGQVHLYCDDVLLTSSFTFTSDDEKADAGDGQESFTVYSSEPFDSISFITKNHKDYVNGTTTDEETHDYFLEYLDLCCPTDAKITGDPHIQRWSGAKYDFHGVCDLVLLKNPDFRDGLGMDIHVRTKQIKQFSYVSSAVLRIGDDTLEVMGDVHENMYWINKEANANLDTGINGFPISYRKVNSKQHEFIVDLGNDESIVMRTFQKFVRVSFQGATTESYGTSRGLLGSYGSGEMIARDNSRILEDTDEFGLEWQVLPADGMLFHNVEGPQAPAKCQIPRVSNLRRRLGESTISEEQAEVACGRVNPADFDMCVFDVMATGDKDVVGAY